MAELAEPVRKRRVIDRISQLPDSLLCHIISFLPTKVAVVTGILSKRWRFLWSLVPTLDLDDELSPEKEYKELTPSQRRDHMSFEQFVYSVLILRRAQPIKSFRLKCNFPNCTQFNVNTWVDEAIRSRVEQFELCLPRREGIKVPHSVFTCSTIVSLKLSGLYLYIADHSSVHLPSLKILHFGMDVDVAGHGILFKLLLGCPVLETLVLESMHAICCVDGMVQDDGLSVNLSNLVEAKFVHFDYSCFCNWCFYNLTKALRDVKNLTLSRTISERLASPRRNLDFDLAFQKSKLDFDGLVFHNLVQLEIEFGTYFWDWLNNLLQNSLKLEVLIISKPYAYIHDEGTSWRHPHDVPRCLESHLKKFCFLGYRGMKCELEFAGFILKNARVLETMTIHGVVASNLEARLEILGSLCACPRSSSKCQLLFH